jgi:hypothetical protein
MDQNKEDQIEEQDRCKRQKKTHEPEKEESHECKLCYVESSSAILKCGHEMCTECCIKHFRKTVNCPFCRTVICEKEDRTDEYKHIITDELHDRYILLDYEPIKEMSMYEFLKFKGLNRKDAREIIDGIKGRCLEMFEASEQYIETSSSIKEDWEYQWDSSESEDEDEEKE